MQKPFPSSSVSSLSAFAAETVGAFLRRREELKRRFPIDPQPLPWLEEHTRAADRLFRELAREAGKAGEVGEAGGDAAARFTLIATGGYGRRELYPHSDIDVLFLTDAPHTACGAIEAVLYGLWDAGFKLGHRVLGREEALARIEEDSVFCTSMLDARFLAGDESDYLILMGAFQGWRMERGARSFIEAKLSERNRLHARWNDSRYVLEPNIKDGKGGLRDVQTIAWLARYISPSPSSEQKRPLSLLDEEETRRLEEAHRFLQQIRIYLHLLAGRAEERLTFDFQTRLARALGYYDDGMEQAVERFMNRYFLAARTVGQAMRSAVVALEERGESPRRFVPAASTGGASMDSGLLLEGDRLAFTDDSACERSPRLLVTLFTEAHRLGLRVHPKSLALCARNLKRIDAGIRRDPGLNAGFLDMLASGGNPEPSLRLMNDTGVLGRFIPDFGRIVGKMQFDTYHVFTVDEHTIIALGILHEIMTGKYRDEMPIASQTFSSLASKRAVFLALFAHDLAKGRGGDHSQLGEVIVRKLARRFGFDAGETEDCAWLVRHHLSMSMTAFKRDLQDPQTILDFVAQVRSLDRLRQLLILTVADIRAVGPNVWNGWKGALLRTLYRNAEAFMGGATGAREEEAFTNAFDMPHQARINALMQTYAAGEQAYAFDLTHDSFHDVTELLLCTPDRKGLFSNVAGAILLAGATIAGAKLFTFKNEMAVELFSIQSLDGASFGQEEQIRRLRQAVTEALEGLTGDLEARLAQSLHTPWPRRFQAYKVPTRVLIDNGISAHHTVIEVTGRDQPGFLYHVTRTLSALGCHISTAHISTYGEQAVDVFYVKDKFGLKIHHLDQMRHIRGTLARAIDALNPTKSARTGIRTDA